MEEKPSGFTNFSISGFSTVMDEGDANYGIAFEIANLVDRVRSVLHHDVAVHEIERLVRDPLPERVQDTAGAEDLGLVADLYLHLVASRRRTAPIAVGPGLYLLVQTVGVEGDVVHAPGPKHGDNASEHRLAPHGHERLRRRARKRPEPSAVARRQNNRLANFHLQ